MAKWYGERGGTPAPGLGKYFPDGAPHSRRRNETLTFVSEPFDQECDWKLHETAAWRDLAFSVMQVGYLSDLSHFMLAEAARGLGLKEASATCYKRALAAGKEHGCGSGMFSCEGFEVQKQAAAALTQ